MSYVNLQKPAEGSRGRVVTLDNVQRMVYDQPPRQWDPQTIRESVIYQTGDLLIDRGAQIIFKGGEMLMATPTEFELILHLVEHQTCFCAREVLINVISSRLRHCISDNTLSKHICRVRKKLGDDEIAPYILTQNSKGYKWNFPETRRFITRETLV